MAKSERLLQHSVTGQIRPSVKIVSCTENPVGTLFCVWQGTRYDKSFDPRDIQHLYDLGSAGISMERLKDASRFHEYDIAEEICKMYPEYAGEFGKDYYKVVLSIAKKVMESNVPAGEAVHLTIQIDNANVAWREQLVRGRISQQFWTMSSRIMDMTTMDVNMSDSIPLIGGERAVKKYEDCVDSIRKTYEDLVAMGIPMEDIRLQPQQHVHRVYWMVPIRTLLTILNKRSDWIAQSSLWSPIVSGVIKELRERGLYDIVEDCIGKPMVKVDDGKVVEYIMNADNEDRYSGRDKIPCDPLWLAYKGLSMPEHTDIPFYDYLKSLYINIWSDEYLEVVGWDRNHPEKLGPYDRPA